MTILAGHAIPRAFHQFHVLASSSNWVTAILGTLEQFYDRYYFVLGSWILSVLKQGNSRTRKLN